MENKNTDSSSNENKELATERSLSPRPALVSCPFCGAQPEINKPHVSLGRVFRWVACSCGACGPESQSKAGAIALWNARAMREEHYLPNYLWCGRCQAWIETQHTCGAQYIDRGAHFELVREAVVLPTSDPLALSTPERDAETTTTG